MDLAQPQFGISLPPSLEGDTMGELFVEIHCIMWLKKEYYNRHGEIHYKWWGDEESEGTFFSPITCNESKKSQIEKSLVQIKEKSFVSARYPIKTSPELLYHYFVDFPSLPIHLNLILSEKQDPIKVGETVFDLTSLFNDALSPSMGEDVNFHPTELYMKRWISVHEDGGEQIASVLVSMNIAFSKRLDLRFLRQKTDRIRKSLTSTPKRRNRRIIIDHGDEDDLPKKKTIKDQDEQSKRRDKMRKNVKDQEFPVRSYNEDPPRKKQDEGDLEDELSEEEITENRKKKEEEEEEEEEEKVKVVSKKIRHARKNENRKKPRKNESQDDDEQDDKYFDKIMENAKVLYSEITQFETDTNENIFSDQQDSSTDNTDPNIKERKEKYREVENDDDDEEKSVIPQNPVFETGPDYDKLAVEPPPWPKPEDLRRPIPRQMGEKSPDQRRKRVVKDGIEIIGKQATLFDSKSKIGEDEEDKMMLIRSLSNDSLDDDDDDLEDEGVVTRDLDAESISLLLKEDGRDDDLEDDDEWVEMTLKKLRERRKRREALEKLEKGGEEDEDTEEINEGERPEPQKQSPPQPVQPSVVIHRHVHEVIQPAPQKKKKKEEEEQEEPQKDEEQEEEFDVSRYRLFVSILKSKLLNLPTQFVTFVIRIPVCKNKSHLFTFRVKNDEFSETSSASKMFVLDSVSYQNQRSKFMKELKQYSCVIEMKSENDEFLGVFSVPLKPFVRVFEENKTEEEDSPSSSEEQKEKEDQSPLEIRTGIVELENPLEFGRPVALMDLVFVMGKEESMEGFQKIVDENDLKMKTKKKEEKNRQEEEELEKRQQQQQQQQQEEEEEEEGEDEDELLWLEPIVEKNVLRNRSKSVDDEEETELPLNRELFNNNRDDPQPEEEDEDEDELESLRQRLEQKKKEQQQEEERRRQKFDEEVTLDPHPSKLRVVIHRAAGLQQAIQRLNQRHDLGLQLASQAGVNPYVHFQVFPPPHWDGQGGVMGGYRDIVDQNSPHMKQQEKKGEEVVGGVKVIFNDEADDGRKSHDVFSTPILARTFCPVWNFDLTVPFLLDESNYEHFEKGYAIFKVYHRIPQSSTLIRKKVSSVQQDDDENKTSSDDFSGGNPTEDLLLGMCRVSLSGLLVSTKGVDRRWASLHDPTFEGGRDVVGALQVSFGLDRETQRILRIEENNRFNNDHHHRFKKNFNFPRPSFHNGELKDGETKVEIEEPENEEIHEVCKIGVIIEEIEIPQKEIYRHANRILPESISSTLLFPCRYYIRYPSPLLSSTKKKNMIETRFYGASSSFQKLPLHYSNEFDVPIGPPLFHYLKNETIEFQLYVVIGSLITEDDDKFDNDGLDDDLEEEEEMPDGYDRRRSRRRRMRVGRSSIHDVTKELERRKEENSVYLGSCFVTLSPLLFKKMEAPDDAHLVWISGKFTLIHEDSKDLSKGSMKIKVVCETLSETPTQNMKRIKNEYRWLNHDDVGISSDDKKRDILRPGMRDDEELDDMMKIMMMKDDHNAGRRRRMVRGSVEHTKSPKRRGVFDDDVSGEEDDQKFLEELKERRKLLFRNIHSFSESEDEDEGEEDKKEKSLYDEGIEVLEEFKNKISGEREDIIHSQQQEEEEDQEEETGEHDLPPRPPKIIEEDEPEEFEDQKPPPQKSEKSVQTPKKKRRVRYVEDEDRYSETKIEFGFPEENQKKLFIGVMNGIGFPKIRITGGGERGEDQRKRGQLLPPSTFVTAHRYSPSQLTQPLGEGVRDRTVLVRRSCRPEYTFGTSLSVSSEKLDIQKLFFQVWIVEDDNEEEDDEDDDYFEDMKRRKRSTKLMGKCEVDLGVLELGMPIDGWYAVVNEFEDVSGARLRIRVWVEKPYREVFSEPHHHELLEEDSGNILIHHPSMTTNNDFFIQDGTEKRMKIMRDLDRIQEQVMNIGRSSTTLDNDRFTFSIDNNNNNNNEEEGIMSSYFSITEKTFESEEDEEEKGMISDNNNNNEDHDFLASSVGVEEEGEEEGNDLLDDDDDDDDDEDEEDMELEEIIEGVDDLDEEDDDDEDDIGEVKEEDEVVDNELAMLKKKLDQSLGILSTHIKNISTKKK